VSRDSKLFLLAWIFGLLWGWLLGAMILSLGIFK
jgi:hypothetical protein